MVKQVLKYLNPLIEGAARFPTEVVQPQDSVISESPIGTEPHHPAGDTHTHSTARSSMFQLPPTATPASICKTPSEASSLGHVPPRGPKSLGSWLLLVLTSAGLTLFWI